MKNQKGVSLIGLVMILAVVVAIAMGAACTLVGQSTGPTTVVVQNYIPASTGLQPAAGGGQASAGGVCAGTPYSERAGFYGFDGDACKAPNNNGGVLPLSCRGLATVTPKLPGGTDDHAFDDTKPSWAVTSGPCSVLSPGAESNYFNAFISWPSGVAVGTSCTVQATVCGKSADFTFKAE